MDYDLFFRVLSWTSMIFIIFSSVVPINIRPPVIFNANFDRAFALFILTVLFSIAYPNHLLLVLFFGIVFVVATEASQFMSKTRHPRLSDALVKSAGCFAGVIFSFWLLRLDLSSNNLERNLLIPTLLLTTIGTFLTAIANITAKKALKTELEPFMTVEFINSDKYVWKTDRFFADGKPVDELWLRIHNAGKSPAIITAIYRRWSVCSRLKGSKEVDWPKPISWKDMRSSPEKKSGSIPVAGGGQSDIIRVQYGQIRDGKGGSGEFPVFDGFFEYRDLNNVDYVCGFCIVYARGYFHTAWIQKDPEKYSYRYIIK